MILFVRKEYKILSILTILVILLSPKIIIKYIDPTLYFLDVGQGDSSIYISSNNVVVIDAFNNVGNFLNNKGINEIDYLILSHSDQDHIQEANDLINKFTINNIILSKYDNNYNLLINKNTKILHAESNLLVESHELSLTFLGPVRSYQTSNNNSLVFSFKYHDISFLFTGDIELEAEIDIIEKYQDNLKNDYLKVAHHGSSTSSSLDFIKLVNPLSAIVSVGLNNKYSHPSSDVIYRLDSEMIKVYRTDMHKTIIFRKNKFHLMEI